MREIKFRGKRVDNGEWVYGYFFKTPLTDESTNSKSEDGWFFLCGKERYCISNQDGCVYEVLPETVGQFTGLKDKNGVEIYDDSLLKDSQGNIGRVFYSNDSASFLVNWKRKDGSYETDSCIGYGVVVGDAYSTPNLLT